MTAVLVPIDEPLVLASTLLGGQAFRWRWEAPWFSGVVFGNIVRIRRTEAGVEFISAPDGESTMAPLLSDYLGLDADLEKIYGSIARDEHLGAAIAQYRGLRILHQDPWECLISFICSSASNIPRISRNIEDICTTFGRPVSMGRYVRHTFPTPDELADASVESLRKLRLGFRARFVVATARTIADGNLDLMALREDSYEEALKALTTLDGVGDKVANCVLLFSLDKPEAFPVDAWVHRALREWYLDGKFKGMSRPKMRLWAQEYFGPHAGYANQYLFHDRRVRGKDRGASGYRCSEKHS